jgi:hypothetical protein
VGDHVLNQNDVRAGGKFADTVAYGGWSMDDHHPAGIYYPGKPTIFHPAPSPYGIPYRSLYSRNIANLLFAGRNISVTHAALSSTRVMATCSIIGQAAGTAAALCAKYGCAPRALSSGPRLTELQHTLMDDDCWLPGVPRPAGQIARAAKVTGAGEGAPLLTNGIDRDLGKESHAWVGPVGSAVEFQWDRPVPLAGVRMTFDSDLGNVKRMPCTYPQKGARSLVPSSLVKAFRIEAQDDAGRWTTVGREESNYQRLVRVPLNVRAKAVRLVPEATWGAEAARVFAFEPLESYEGKIPTVPSGPSFAEVRARIAKADLAPPDSGLETGTAKRSGA